MAANQGAIPGAGGGGMINPGEEEALIKAIMAEALGQSSQQMAGRGMPMRNLNQEQGYGDLNQPQQFGKSPIVPRGMTFDTKTAGARNYAGIINSFDPQLYATSEQLLQKAQALAPTAQNAIAYHGSIYTGVPDDFATNRLYIYNTRRRENSIYAFV